jgi:curved DNA-binding protein CbpA
MENYYSLLGVDIEAPQAVIKKAFREKAKQFHPDLAGTGHSNEEAMRRILAAWETLSNPERRAAYDRSISRFVDRGDGFEYSVWLRKNMTGEDEKLASYSRAKLVFFELLHLEEADAVRLWREGGGLDFQMARFLDREDWMDGTFLLAEELERSGDHYSAFMLLAAVLGEERRKPYFRHFTQDVEGALREIVRLHLKKAVDADTWQACLKTCLKLGFPYEDNRRWRKMLDAQK